MTFDISWLNHSDEGLEIESIKSNSFHSLNQGGTLILVLSILRNTKSTKQ